MTLHLSGTEKQRDNALEALFLQQEVAEKLERERKRNKKELSAFKRTNATLVRQKEEAQRVVVHLRSLIDGQAHHMEHIIRSVNKAPELLEYADEGFGWREEDEQRERQASIDGSSNAFRMADSRTHSRASTTDGKLLDGEDVQPDMERRLFGSPMYDGRSSRLSVADVADRHLQDKTDAIADIIRNISDQCAAAVEGLHLAQDADNDGMDEHDVNAGDSKLSLSDGEDIQERSSPTSDVEEHEVDRHLLHPQSSSPYPPTPDLVHRSSTSMSINSQSTTPERHSQQFTDLPTKIVEDDDEQEHEHEHEESAAEVVGEESNPTITTATATATTTTINKQPSASLFRRPAGARISALGQA